VSLSAWASQVVQKPVELGGLAWGFLRAAASRLPLGRPRPEPTEYPGVSVDHQQAKGGADRARREGAPRQIVHAAILALAALCYAQAWAQVIRVPPVTTVAELPTPSTALKGRIYAVTDGLDATDCTVGGGSAVAHCYDTGAAWVALSTAGGGGPPSGAAGGDLAGTYPNPTIGANAVALGTDTTGFYVASFTAGAGLSGDGSGEGSAPTIATASQEVGFLADGSAADLTCGASAQGKAQVMDAGTLQICDGAATSLLSTFYPGPHAGSATEGGPAASVADNSVALGEDTTGPYAAGDGEAGDATGLVCTTCVGTTDIADDAITSGKVGFNFAGSGSEGGAATTATALAANGTDCSAGQAARGVDAGGNAESCFTPAGGSPAGSGTELQYRVDGSTFGAVTSSTVSGAAVTFGGLVTVGGGAAFNNPDLRIGSGTSGIANDGTLRLVLSGSEILRVRSDRAVFLGGSAAQAPSAQKCDHNGTHRCFAISDGGSTGLGAGGTEDGRLIADGSSVVGFARAASLNRATVYGGLDLDSATGGTKPTCDSAVRGWLWYTEGGTGVADAVEVCRKSAADTYAWAAISLL
jgi:hypothetical protein